MNYLEYTTLVDWKAAKTPGSTATSDDGLMLAYIREVSKEINHLTGRTFAPVVATRLFDACRAVDGRLLLVAPYDLLAVTTLTNGDSTVITGANYTFETSGMTPYWAIRLKASSGYMWTYTTDPEDAISVAGVWGYHDDYANAWETLTTVAANATSNTTSITLTAGVGNPGELWQIDSEYLYLSARTTTTATVVRGVNGSTAASHATPATISRWVPMADVAGLCKAAAIMEYTARENPQQETLIIDGRTFQVAKDWRVWVEQELARLGLRRQ